MQDDGFVVPPVRPERGGGEPAAGDHLPLLVEVVNILWLFLFGWEIAVAHLISALLLAITLLGLPFARQHIKLIALALFPFGRELV